jgi:hypothetical protein
MKVTMLIMDTCRTCFEKCPKVSTSWICGALNRLWEEARGVKEGSVLIMCFCKPKPCHGDVIKRVLEEELLPSTEAEKDNQTWVTDARPLEQPTEEEGPRTQAQAAQALVEEGYCPFVPFRDGTSRRIFMLRSGTGETGSPGASIKMLPLPGRRHSRSENK